MINHCQTFINVSVNEPPSTSCQAEKDFNEAVSELKRTIAEITRVNPLPQPSNKLNDDTTKVLLKELPDKVNTKTSH